MRELTGTQHSRVVVVVELVTWSGGVGRQVCDCDQVEGAELAWGMRRSRLSGEPEAETDEECYYNNK
ncbi:Hypothetical predicted protein, partial [Scomber scombrus]